MNLCYHNSSLLCIPLSWKTSPGEWKSVNDPSDVQEIQSLCSIPDHEETGPINYKQFYDALMKLKDSISANDVLTILWLVPSFSLFSAPVLSVRSDSQKAPFLYLGLEALQNASKSSELSIITHDNSNDLAVWTRLFVAVHIGSILLYFLFPLFRTKSHQKMSTMSKQLVVVSSLNILQILSSPLNLFLSIHLIFLRLNVKQSIL